LGTNALHLFSLERCKRSSIRSQGARPDIPLGCQKARLYHCCFRPTQVDASFPCRWKSRRVWYRSSLRRVEGRANDTLSKVVPAGGEKTMICGLASSLHHLWGRSGIVETPRFRKLQQSKGGKACRRCTPKAQFVMTHRGRIKHGGCSYRGTDLTLQKGNNERTGLKTARSPFSTFQEYTLT
jgi:hypothetical protein